MPNVTNVQIYISTSGDTVSYQVINCVPNPNSAFEIRQMQLIPGLNQLSWPSADNPTDIQFFVHGVLIVPPVGNLSHLVLKSNPADINGIGLHKTNPTFISLDHDVGSGQAIYLDVSVKMVVRIAWV
jgi:hypothetical protein